MQAELCIRSGRARDTMTQSSNEQSANCLGAEQWYEHFEMSKSPLPMEMRSPLEARFALVPRG